MKNPKKEILEKHCYTELVYKRINKKLKINLNKIEVESLIKNVLQETDISNYIKNGKNFYVTNLISKIMITINSNTFRIITVDKIKT